MSVLFKNPDTDQIKQVKVGFSWTLLLFSGFFGLPLFMRRVYPWAWGMLALALAHGFVGTMIPGVDRGSVQFMLGVLQFALQVYLGFNGNKITAKHYLKKGWTLIEPNSLISRGAMARWHLEGEGRRGHMVREGDRDESAGLGRPLPGT